MPMQMKYFLMTAALIAGISLGAHAGERIEHTISVVGEGQASAVPDKAWLSVGGESFFDAEDAAGPCCSGGRRTGYGD